MSASSSSDRPNVLVIGGGIIGISTAIALQDHPTSPYNVTIIAKDLPSRDPTTYLAGSSNAAPSSYASAWAGAHHVSDAKTAEQLKMDQVTFEMLRRLKEKLNYGDKSDSRDAAIIEVHQVEYFGIGSDIKKDALNWYPQYCTLSPSTLPADVEFGCTFRTFDINVPQYLPLLHQLFFSLGGRFIPAEVKTISDGVKIFLSSTSNLSGLQAIIVSPGLGAIDLLDDTSVHPVRGQTVLIRAPWCTTAPNRDALGLATDMLDVPTWFGMSRVNDQGFRDMYILPRGDGTFIIGGTRLVNDWDAEPRDATTDEIIQRALQYMPSLAFPSEDEEKKVDIIGVNVGLRPARSEGVRLERGESIDDIPVIYSYGYGGFGYQCSWGSAFTARDLVDDALHRSRAPSQSTIASLNI